MPKFSLRWMMFPTVISTVMTILAIDPSKKESVSSVTEVIEVSDFSLNSEEREKAQMLKCMQEQVQSRISRKEQIIDAIVSGQCNLGHATYLFHQLTREQPEAIEYMRTLSPEWSEEERVAKNVLDYLRHRSTTPRGQDMLCQIEYEYCERYGHPATWQH